MADVKEYYAITTKKFTLRTSHDGWLLATQKIYNDVLHFYYCPFLEYPEIHHLGKQRLLREMERLSIVGREKLSGQRGAGGADQGFFFRRHPV